MNDTPSEHGREMTRLLDRLYGDPERRTLHFSITPGPLWNTRAAVMTEEEKAKTINDALDSRDDRSAELIEHFDD